jgi:DNA mismatch repair ATPase MutL
MKRQNRIAKILSTTLAAALLFSQSVQAQQSSGQTSTQEPQEGTQQPQAQNQATQSAQSSTAPANTTAPANPQLAAEAGQNQPAQSPQTTNPSGTTINPSQAPLQPVTSYPDASGAPQEEPLVNTAPQQSNLPQGPQPKQPSEPVGAAAAESVPTAGGAAAKPAGVAIAPAKQHQTRSLLIKLGAALAAGAAVGTIYALSHGTSSTPPGASMPGVTQK